MSDKETKMSDGEQTEKPKRGVSRPVKVEAPASVALKAKLDALIVERDMLASKRAEHHENLVEAWGTKGADDVAMTVATHDVKLSALNTIIERTTVELRNAVNAERSAEYEALLAEHEKLLTRRNSANDTVRVARQAVIDTQIAADSAARDFESAMNEATKSAARRTVDEIDATYQSAQKSLAESAKKLADLTDCQVALQKVHLDYLDAYHVLLVNERRTMELSNSGA